jgi:hypothetical protein
MTLENGAAWFTVHKAKQDILNDPSMGVFGKAEALGALNRAVKAPGASQHQLTIGDMIHGAVGAGLGLGAGALMGKLFSLPNSVTSVMQGAGVGLGTMFMTGLGMKTAAEREHAFELGFVKAALDLGLIKESGIMGVIPLTDMVTAPFTAATSIGKSLASNAGAALGTLDSLDDNDSRLAQMEIESRELNGTADDLEAKRRQQVLRQILSRRTASR